MALRLHHVFVCTRIGAPEAADLVDAGLLEGSPNTHPGQGTANRRFFFERGFLELLWVHNEREARSMLTESTGLWERWTGRGDTANPFGICLSSAGESGSTPPFPCRTYRPEYLPDDRCFFFADGLPLSEPEIFLPSWPQDAASPEAEPTQHPLGLREMLSVSIGVTDTGAVSDSLRATRDAGLVDLHHSAAPQLVIRFASDQDIHLEFPALGISIVAKASVSRPGN